MKKEKKVLKVHFSKCPLSFRKEIFKKSSCIVPISVGQNLNVHEGEKFLATILLLNSSFKKVTLLIDDTIQRHTLKIWSNKPDEFFYNNALLEGDKWLARNKWICDKLTIPYNISRWSDWLTHLSYKEKRDNINKLYQVDSIYQFAVNSTIEEYLERLSNRAEDIYFNRENAFSCCLEYLLEECSVMWLWAQEKYDFEVYPSGRNLAMKVAYELAIKHQYPNLLISVSLHFKRHLIKDSQIIKELDYFKK